MFCLLLDFMINLESSNAYEKKLLLIDAEIALF